MTEEAKDRMGGWEQEEVGLWENFGRAQLFARLVVEGIRLRGVLTNLPLNVK